MKLGKPIKLKDLADSLSLPYSGNGELYITGINEIHKVQKGDLTFVDHPKYYKKALQSDATFILIDKEMEVPEGKGLIYTDEPFRHYNNLTKKYRPFVPAKTMINSTSVVGEGTIIQPGGFIGHHVKIGKGCVIQPNVVIHEYVEISDRVIIQANSVIGSDAFYYRRYKDKEVQYKKMHSCGRVIIESDVEIGAGCTIDRGVSGDTIIGSGTKIDNHVHIGHGVVINENCLIAAQVGIAGKTIIEKEVMLWGQVGVSKSLTIGEKAEVYAQSGVHKSIDGHQKYFGSPVQEALSKMKELAAVKKLPELFQQWLRDSSEKK
jgi:UDP-3-O-[3-hydroxymyristoyl] glucosamine N-acyltransferase